MPLSRRSSTLAVISLTALVGAVFRAQAGGFAINTQSTKATGHAFAGAASGSGGLSSTFWNPATITMTPGWQSEWSVSTGILNLQVDPLPPTPTLLFGGSGDIGQDAVIPTSYMSYQWNEWLWSGLAVTSPFGLVTKPNNEWAGQVYSRSSKLFTLNLNPIVGIRFTDWLSFGAGPMIEFIDTRLKRALAVTPGAPSLILEGDDTSVGFTAGVTLTPRSGTAIGIGFRSSTNHRLEGNLISPGLRLPTRTSLNTPEVVTIGITQQVMPNLTLHGGLEWTNWSRLGAPGIVGPSGPIGSFPLNWQDGFLISIGTEYTFTPRWVFRAGVGYDKAPATDLTRATRLPDSDRIWASVGASYKWSEKLSFDLAYAHIFFRDARIAILPGHQDFSGLPFVADVDAGADIISMAVTYRWDDGRVVTPAAPIVRRAN